jgi:outer membrane protein OmpA-like peptidoglycan-associated protein
MKPTIEARRAATLSGLALALALQLANATPACDDGKRYLGLAHKAGSQQDFTRAVEWLERSVAACDSYEAWHLMGTAQQRQRNLAEALEAYARAVDHAPDADSAAVSVARYGQVLALNGQRYEALNMLERALAMHTSPPSWIRTAAKEIDLDIVDRPISRDSIKRSLSTQEFGLLASVRLREVAAESAREARTRIGIPINFEFDSVRLDNLTRSNLSQLGAVLAEKQHEGKTFTLVGHTDVRGDPAYNLSLSESRARAIQQALVQEYPVLSGRLQVEGAGEANPKYPGAGIPEEEHRLNRRLEVFVN